MYRSNYLEDMIFMAEIVDLYMRNNFIKLKFKHNGKELEQHITLRMNSIN